MEKLKKIVDKVNKALKSREMEKLLSTPISHFELRGFDENYKEKEIRLLCRPCSDEEIKKAANFGYYLILAEEKSGYCDKCGICTGYLKVVEITTKRSKLIRGQFPRKEIEEEMKKKIRKSIMGQPVREECVVFKNRILKNLK